LQAGSSPKEESAVPHASAQPYLRFGRIELQGAQRRVLVDGQPAAIGARAFDLLLALAQRRERVVGKNELFELVWPGLVVEENNLQVQVSALRKALGPQVIATIPGRGYRFTLEPDDAAEAAEPAPDTTAASSHTNLTLETDALIGRDAEVDALGEQLAAHRIVSVVGGGGIGKTRLARAVARCNLERFPDGVWWVDLSALGNGARIAQTIAHAVGAPLGDGDGPALLARALAPRRLLLVLDNCEQLADGVAAVLLPLLAGAPGVRVLVTSQVALHAPAEQVWRLDALSLPPPGASLQEARRHGAFALFEERARAADQRFALDEAGLAQAIELCRHLDGNALAIEMAAARAPQIGLRALNQRLAERLRLLRANHVAPAPHQQSLRAMLDWSCSLLADAQNTVLKRLAVFTGSFALEAAQQVVADDTLDEWTALDALGALVDRSLLQVERFDPPRYRLLETTRLYAAEQLAAAGEAQRSVVRHGQAMASLARRARDEFFVLTHAAFLERYAADYADLDAAFEQACARRDAPVAAATAQVLSALDTVRGILSVRRHRMAAAHALLPVAQDARDRAWLWNQVAPVSSIALPGVPRLDVARERVQAWRAVGDRQELYLALADLAAEFARVGDLASARAAAAESSALEDRAWPPALRSLGAQVDSDLALYGRDMQASRNGMRRALALAEQAGDARRAAHARFRLADHATAAGDIEEAIALGQESVAEMQRLRRPASHGMALSNLCAAYLQAGDDEHARDAAAQALPLLRPNLYAGVLFNHLALLAVRAGDAESAARLLGHADQWYLTYQSPQRQTTEQRVMEPAVAAIVAAIGEAACKRLRAEGAALDDVQADALAWCVLGRLIGG
jgi:predicted ATPase/DNA-binding winged helix-turn-helix (wHTH) protein